MPPPSPREELLNIHKQLYRHNKVLIEESVQHEDRAFHAYERRYLRAVRDYDSVSSVEEVMEAVMGADIIYVGDYHTLNQSQRSLLRILRLLVQKTTDFAIGLEVVQGRHQEILDRFLQDKITDKTFLQKTGFQKHWFFDLWANFVPLFDFAKYHKIPVYGLEAKPEVGTSLEKRDVETARRIIEISQKEPAKKIIIFVGDLHLAPQHLPRQVEKIFAVQKMTPKTVTLYQNSEAIYWKLADREIEQQADVVKISKNEFCRMHTPPIIAQQSYLNWLEHEEGVLDYADARHTFLGYMDQVAAFLGIELTQAKKEEIEVFTCGDLSFLKRLRESRDLPAREFRQIKKQILRSESYCIPSKKIVYIANVSVNHAAEEASHMIRFLKGGPEIPRSRQDAFYANALHEAIGFFGSKVINHKRKCLRPSDARNLTEYLSSSGSVKERFLEFRMATLFLEHDRQLKKGLPFHPNKIFPLSTDLFFAVTHAIGYFLGEKMFHGLLAEKLTKDEIRSLFDEPFDEEGAPVKRFLELEKRLKGIKLPRKI